MMHFTLRLIMTSQSYCQKLPKVTTFDFRFVNRFLEIHFEYGHKTIILFSGWLKKLDVLTIADF